MPLIDPDAAAGHRPRQKLTLQLVVLNQFYRMLANENGEREKQSREGGQRVPGVRDYQNYALNDQWCYLCLLGMFLTTELYFS